MSEFVGTVPGKLDSKNRILIPSEFRPEGRNAAEQIAFRLSYQRPCIEAQSRAAFDELRAAIARMPLLSEERDEMESAIIAETHLIRPDGESRVILPPEMMREAGFTPGTELAFVGKGDRFEIWSRAEWHAQRTAVRQRVRERGLTLPVVPNPGAVS
jgi:MraZ protein